MISGDLGLFITDESIVLCL